MNIKNNKWILASLPLCMGLMIWSCEEPKYETPKVESGNFGKAQVRFVQMVADTNRIGLKIDNDTLAGSLLNFGQASNYVDVNAGANRQIKLGNTSFTTTAALLLGVKYTLVASGTYRNRRVNWQLIEDRFPAANGKTMVRFLNFSGRGDTLRLREGINANLFGTPYIFRTKDRAGADSSFTRTLTGNRLFNVMTESVRATVRGRAESLTYSLATFEPFEPGTKTWQIIQNTRRATPSLLYPLNINMDFEAGKYYSILVSGGNAGKPLGFTVITHN